MAHSCFYKLSSCIAFAYLEALCNMFNIKLMQKLFNTATAQLTVKILHVLMFLDAFAA